MWILNIPVFLFFLVPVLAEQRLATTISEAELKRIVTPLGCEDIDKTVIHHLEYFDFDGDGQDEAVTVASTCAAGTGGPDVHSVYTRAANGKIAELPLRDLPFRSNKIPLFGNRNYSLTVEDRKLVARWKDTSDRENPLVVWYNWSRRGFLVDHLKVEGPFQTSYDCAKATTEMDRAICYSPALAAMDVQLGQIYRERMQGLSSDERRILQAQQLQWRIEREKRCTSYKLWVDCLSESYAKRITELKQKW